MEDLTRKAVFNVFGRYFIVGNLDTLLARFDERSVMETGNEIPSREYVKRTKRLVEITETLIAGEARCLTRFLS